MTWLSGYNKRIKIPIDHSKVDADLSDFPVTVFFTSTQGEEIFNEFTLDSQYMKCAFTKADGVTQLYAEKEMFDVAGKKAIYHVKVPSVSSSADTDIYYYYNKNASDNTTYVGAIGTTAGEHVWDSNFCYDKETEILTDSGWKLFRDLDKTERVATLNPQTGELEFKKPTKYISYKYKGKLFHIAKSQQLDLAVIPDHNMYVSDRYGKKYKLRKARDIFDKQVRYKKDAIWKGTECALFTLPSVEHFYDTGNQYKSGVLKTKTIPERYIKMDDWVEFLGYYLSEGCTKYQDKMKRQHYTVTIAQSENHIEQRNSINSCLERLGFKFRYDGQAFIIHNKQLAQYLKQFGKSKDRFIPEEFKKLSRRQLRILFDALMLGDGASDGTSYATVSKKMAGDFQELLLKIGTAGNVGIDRRNKKNSNLQNIYTIGIITGEKYGQLKPHVYNKDKAERTAHNEWIDYDDMVYSVNVENHVVYVRRNGKGVWSGNCLVYHMVDNTTSTILDSTSNSHDGTKKAANEPIEAAGKVGKGQDFDGTDDYINIANNAGLRPQYFTISAIVKHTATGWREIFQTYYQNTTVAGIEFRQDNSNKLQLVSGKNTGLSTGTDYQQISSAASINTGNDTYVTGTYDGVKLRVFINGVNAGEIAWTTDPGYDAANNRINIGVNNYVGTTFVYWFENLMDEVRVSSVARSAAWDKATYNALWDTLLTYGSEEMAGNTIFFGFNF